MDEKRKAPGEEFIAAVCEKVHFKPARKQIADELRGHLEDRAEALMARGLTPRDAVAQAARSMGDPEEIGTALDKEHSPLWGWSAELTGVLGRVAAIALAVCLAGSWLQYDSRGELIDGGFFWFRDQSFAGETLCREPLMLWCETEDHFVLLTGLKVTGMPDGQGAAQVDRVVFCKDPFRSDPREDDGLSVTLRAGEQVLPLYLETGTLERLTGGDGPPETLTLELTTDLGEYRTVDVPVEWRSDP